MKDLYYVYMLAGLVVLVVVVVAIAATDWYILFKASPERRATIFVVAFLALLGLMLLDYLWTGREPRFGPQSMFLVFVLVVGLLIWIGRRLK
jgi:hypothetical protein